MKINFDAIKEKGSEIRDGAFDKLCDMADNHPEITNNDGMHNYHRVSSEIIEMCKKES